MKSQFGGRENKVINVFNNNFELKPDKKEKILNALLYDLLNKDPIIVNPEFEGYLGNDNEIINKKKYIESLLITEGIEDENDANYYLTTLDIFHRDRKKQPIFDDEFDDFIVVDRDRDVMIVLKDDIKNEQIIYFITSLIDNLRQLRNQQGGTIKYKIKKTKTRSKKNKKTKNKNKKTKKRKKKLKI